MIANSPDMVLLSERLNTVNFGVPEYQQLLDMVQRQHESVAVRLDGEASWGPRNRAPVRGIIVTGDHHCGCSDLVQQCVEALEPVKAGDGQSVEPNPRIIDAPFVFTQSSQARAISAALGYGMTRRMTADLAWERVSERLPKAKVTPLVIDNWHWSFTPAQVGQRKYEAEKCKIQAAYVSLLEHAVSPLALVLVARTEVIAQLKLPGMEHIGDRCDTIAIGRMANDDQEHVRLRKGLLDLCTEAGLELTLHDQDSPLQRLIHAADHARGLAIVLCKMAVLHAVRSGASRLELGHLKEVYASTMNASVDDANPFVAEDWTNIDTSAATTNLTVTQQMRRLNRTPKKEDEDA